MSYSDCGDSNGGDDVSSDDDSGDVDDVSSCSSRLNNLIPTLLPKPSCPSPCLYHPVLTLIHVLALAPALLILLPLSLSLSSLTLTRTHVLTHVLCQVFGPLVRSRMRSSSKVRTSLPIDHLNALLATSLIHPSSLPPLLPLP